MAEPTFTKEDERRFAEWWDEPNSTAQSLSTATHSMDAAQCGFQAGWDAAVAACVPALRAVVAEYEQCERIARAGASPGEMDIGRDVVDQVRKAIAAATD